MTAEPDPRSPRRLPTRLRRGRAALRRRLRAPGVSARPDAPGEGADAPSAEVARLRAELAGELARRADRDRA